MDSLAARWSTQATALARKMTATHPAAAARAARTPSLKTERRRPWRRTSSTASQATTNPTSSCTKPTIIVASPPLGCALITGAPSSLPSFLTDRDVAATARGIAARRAGADGSWVWGVAGRGGAKMVRNR